MQEHNEKVIQERKNDLNRQNIGLAFSIDKDTENTVVKVTDLNTEKLVRQIPSEDFLKLAERLKDMRDNTSVSKKILKLKVYFLTKSIVLPHTASKKDLKVTTFRSNFRDFSVFLCH